jgi:hypothetical protein
MTVPALLFPATSAWLLRAACDAAKRYTDMGMDEKSPLSSRSYDSFGRRSFVMRSRFFGTVSGEGKLDRIWV